MTEEREFDYRDYIQRRLREIDDLDERRYAKGLLLDSLGEMFAWTEAKYKALEQRIRDELDSPWERFEIAMTAVSRADYDPVNDFWHPVCAEDLGPDAGRERVTVYLMADDAGCRRFLRQGIVEAEDAVTGVPLRFRIERPERYRACMERTYALFAANHIPWRTVHLGHLERIFDMVPEGDVPPGARPVFQWGDWERQVAEDAVPLWNMQRKTLQSQEFRRPCLDDVVYEQVYYLGDAGDAGDGCLVDAGEDILSVRYERNRVVLKTARKTPGDVSVCRLHQGDAAGSYGYSYPVLSNHRKDSFAARYIGQAGNFIQTPGELMRKAEELSGSFRIRVSGYEILDSAGRDLSGGNLLEGDMNSFTGTQIFAGDQRSLMVFRFRKDGETPHDYLYESQIRYILSQLQMEFPEYRCVGVAE